MNVPQTQNQNLPATAGQEVNPYLAYAESVSSSRIVGKLLRFSKFGEWTAGESGDAIALGTRLVAHIPEMVIGWQRWGEGKPVDAVMGKVSEGFKIPARHTLGDDDSSAWEVDDKGKERDPWQRSVLLLLKEEGGDQIYTFASGSKGGIGATGRLSEAFGHAMRHKAGQLPIITLGRDSYPHSNKAYGDIRFPVFEIVGWAPQSDFDAVLPGGDGGQEQLALPEERQPAPSVPAPRQGRVNPSRITETQDQANQANQANQAQASAASNRKPRF